ncbi:Homeodomain-like protein [Pilaira anomala]|nr:Homeodomain-like protein [Pilaira anomala]
MGGGSGGSGNGSQLSKAKRKRISPAQYNRLMEIFDQTDTPSSEIRENLAQELQMTKREVQVWFQNRRAKMNRTKNLNNNTIRHRHSLIPHTVSNNQFHHLKNRRLSAYQASENYKQSLNNGPYPIAPMPSHSFHPPVPQPVAAAPHPSTTTTTTTFHPSSQYYHHNPSKPSAIDLLASAAEYVRTDRKEMSYSRT